MSFFRQTVLVLFLLSVSAAALADVIHLKNGKQLLVDRAWEEGNRIRYEKDGNLYGFPKDLVEHVESGRTSITEVEQSASASAQPLSRLLPIEALEPTFDPGKTRIGTSLIQDGKIDSIALAALEQAARGAPQDQTKREDYQAALGQVIEFLFKQGDYPLAVDYLQRYLAWDHDNLEAHLALATIYLKEGKYSHAEDILSQARVRHEDSADLNYLLGTAYYLQEKNELARRTLERSLQLRFRPEVDYLLKKIQGENAAEENYRQANSLHFVVKYEGNDNNRALGSDILASLERSYSELERALEFSPRESISVILYPGEVFRDITRVPNWVGALNDGKIRLPIKGISRVDDRLRLILKHELTHSFIRLQSGERCPVWLNEGMAQLMSGESWKDYLPYFKRAASESKLPPLRLLEGTFLVIPHNMVNWAYKQSLLSVEFLVQSEGMSNVEQLVKQAGASDNFETVLKSVLHITYAELQTSLVTFLMRQ